jgi:hypothetical protein
MVWVGNTMTEYSTGSLTVPETPIEVPLVEIFSVLDE